MASTPRICNVCSRVNFAAIFTPKEIDADSGHLKAVYRTEYEGSGKHPLRYPGRKRRTNAPRPHCIGTADYDELSPSSDGDWDEHPDNDRYAFPNIDRSPFGHTPKFHSPVQAEINQAKTQGTLSEKPNTKGGSLRERFKYLPGYLKREKTDRSAKQGLDEAFDHDNDSLSSDDDYGRDVMELGRIDFEKEVAGDWGYRHGDFHQLGSVWDVRSRRHQCDLCWWTWVQIRRDPVVKRRHLTKSRCIMKLAQLLGTDVDNPDREIILLNIVVLYAYKLDDPRRSKWTVKEAFVLQGTHRDVCGVESLGLHNFDDRLWGEGRWLDKECNFKLFRKWLHLCETEHEHVSKGGSGEMVIRLIDVHQRCLIGWSGPASQAPRFVALSYCWGEVGRKVTLNMHCLKEAEEKGFFDRPLDQTVQDAMTVVLKLGERYLWVDALCIIQDSKEDKKMQLPQMQNIYGCAVLTIVAACGEDCDAGLPGVGPNTRQGCAFSVNLKDIRITPRCFVDVRHFSGYTEFHENGLDGAPWQGRAWTFQEAYLSRRALVFTQTQVYWECERCTWCEETCFESSSIDFRGFRGVMDPTPEDIWREKMARKAYDANNDFEGPQKPIRNSYSTIIKEFTKRDLRYDADVIDACSGVLSSIQEREQSGFLFGLREKHFGNDLLFNFLQSTKPRFGKQRPAEAGFPSWSWAFWRGPIEIANEARNNSYDLVKDLLPCDGVRCHMLRHDSSGRQYLQTINKNGGWRSHAGYVRQGEGIENPAKYYRSFDDSSKNNQTESTARITLTTQSQDLTLEEVARHPEFNKITPGLHIIFRTFASPVYLRREYDAISETMLQINNSISGTHMKRGNNIWQSREIEHQKVYALQHVGGNDFELGSYLGFLPQKKQLTQRFIPGVPDPTVFGIAPIYEWAYDFTIADGFYVLLWMNNNQLPMFGHILCRPVDIGNAPFSEFWDKCILQRIAGIVGASDFLQGARQEEYAAKWGTYILT